MTVIAIDIGGSGSRASRSGQDRIVRGPGAALADGRADYRPALATLAEQLDVDGPVHVVVVGAAGLIARGDAPSVAAEARERWMPREVVVASDSLTSLVGAWGLGGGAVVAAGTGVVALGTELASVWVRADGWGPWIGDRGGGSWIGAQGLDAAMRSLDGRRGGSRALGEAARSRYGEPAAIPVTLRRSEDAPALLARFAPDVAAAAAEGDPFAERILAEAAVHLADAATAVLAESVPDRVALVGGISRIDLIASAWADAVAHRHPSAEVAVGTGSALGGALALGESVAVGEPIPTHPPYLTHFTTSAYDPRPLADEKEQK